MLTADEDNKELWEKACEFVSSRLKKIKSHVEKKYLSYSPYEIDDFIEEAYLASFKAFKDCKKRKRELEVEQFFWTNFKFSCNKITHCPQEKVVEEITKASAVSITKYNEQGKIVKKCIRRVKKKPKTIYIPYIHQEYREVIDEVNPSTAMAAEMDPLNKLLYMEEFKEREKIIEKALWVMTVKQRDVWKNLFNYGVNKTAEMMGVKRCLVQQHRDCGLRKVAALRHTIQR